MDSARAVPAAPAEGDDTIMLRTALTIMAECEADLFMLDDFEELITYLKVGWVFWGVEVGLEDVWAVGGGWVGRWGVVSVWVGFDGMPCVWAGWRGAVHPAYG